MDENKQKQLELVLKQLNKDFGKGSIAQMKDIEIQPIESISTGVIGVDLALGVGGIPKGRITEIFGPESSGKTTLTLQTIASAQAKGDICAFIDAEHALDPTYAANLGVDIPSLIFAQPSSGEEALDMVESLAMSGAVDLIVVDSVANLTPKAELDADMEQQSMGLQARMMAKALRKFTGIVSKNHVALIFINQIREKIGGMSFGSNETTTGGRALKFYCSVRIDIRAIGQLKQGEEMIGKKTRVKIIKNKVAPPFKQAEFEIMFGKGVQRAREILDYAVKYDIVDKSGAWYSYGADKVGQGKEKSVEFLTSNPELLSEIEEQVMGKIKEEIEGVA